MAKPFYAEGLYRCRVIDQALSETSKGNAQVVLKFKVLEHIVSNDQTEPVPAQYDRTTWLVITDNTARWVIDQLRQLGYTRDNFRAVDPSEANYHSLRDVEADFRCEHELRDDGPTERWKVWTPQDSKALTEKPLDSKKKRDLDALFGKHFKAATTSKPPAPLAAAPSDQDIPGWV